MKSVLRTTCLRDQESRIRRRDRSFLPKAVGEYSTRTGISANISRLISPSRSNSRSCWVRTFCEMRGMFWRRVLNRSGLPDPMSHQRMTGFQRPPISTSSSSMGHMLAIRLAGMDLGTRYPFGSWRHLESITETWVQGSWNLPQGRDESWSVPKARESAAMGAEQARSLQCWQSL
jgi:hypothetical protein